VLFHDILNITHFTRRQPSFAAGLFNHRALLRNVVQHSLVKIPKPLPENDVVWMPAYCLFYIASYMKIFLLISIFLICYLLSTMKSTNSFNCTTRWVCLKLMNNLVAQRGESLPSCLLLEDF